MEEITEAQSIRLGNFKEQLSLVRTDIIVANKELEAILEKRLSEEGAILDLQKQRDAISDDIKDLYSRHTEAIEGTNTIISNLNKEIDVLKQNRLNLLSQIVDLNESIKTKREFNRTIEDDIDNILSQKELLLKELEDAKYKYNNEYPKIDELVSEIKKLDDKKKLISDTIISLENRFKKEEEELEEDLANMQRKIVEEAFKFDIPRDNLKLETELLERKKKSLDILYHRLKKAFERMYPGQSLDNLIKL